MKRRDLIKSTAALATVPFFGQWTISGSEKKEQTVDGLSANTSGIARFGDGRDWFFEKRFGMFVHWGIYSIPGWHEQHQWRGRIPRAEYVKLADQWNPKKFTPEE